MSGYGVGLQAHRMETSWTCEICGRVIHGKRNTVHLGVISHFNAEWKQGKRPAPYDPYNHKKFVDVRT